MCLIWVFYLVINGVYLITTIDIVGLKINYDNKHWYQFIFAIWYKVFSYLRLLQIIVPFTLLRILTFTASASFHALGEILIHKSCNMFQNRNIIELIIIMDVLISCLIKNRCIIKLLWIFCDRLRHLSNLMLQQVRWCIFRVIGFRFFCYYCVCGI